MADQDETSVVVQSHQSGRFFTRVVPESEYLYLTRAVGPWTTAASTRWSCTTRGATTTPCR
jgi:hypothetical protein